MLNEFRTIVGRMQQCGIGMERNEAEDEETAAGVTGEIALKHTKPTRVGVDEVDFLRCGRLHFQSVKETLAHFLVEDHRRTSGGRTGQVEDRRQRGASKHLIFVEGAHVGVEMELHETILGSPLDPPLASDQSRFFPPWHCGVLQLCDCRLDGVPRRV